MNKYQIIFGVCMALPMVAVAADPAEFKTYGAENKNIVYVFTSPACPHCSAYHEKVLPSIEKEVADAGLAQVILVDMATDHRSLKVAQVGRCMTTPQYEKYMAKIYDAQSEWAYGPEYEGIVKNFAAKAGLDPQKIGECWDDMALATTITNQWQGLSQKYRITGMPTTVLIKGIKKKTYIGADKKIVQQIKDDLK